MRQWQSIKQRDVTDILSPNSTADSSAGSKRSSMLQALRRHKAEMNHKKRKKSRLINTHTYFMVQASTGPLNTPCSQEIPINNPM